LAWKSRRQVTTSGMTAAIAASGARTCACAGKAASTAAAKASVRII
jgi:hypothetical protein